MVLARRATCVAVAVAVALVAACNGDDGSESWHEGPPLPIARLEPGVAAFGDRLAVVGGYDDAIQVVAAGFALDLATDTWSALPDAPVVWTHAALVGHGGALYLLGGLEGTTFIPRGDAFLLDAAATGWTPLPAMPAGTERGAAAVVAGAARIYVIGGATDTAAVATVLAFDVATRAWTSLPDLPAPRSHPAAIALADDTLIVAGGLEGLDAREPRADVWALAPGAPAWTPRAPMPTPRGGCASGAVGASTLVCAGGEAGTTALAVTEAYDAAADAWRSLPPMPQARAGTRGAVIGAALYVPGGASRLVFDPEASLYIYTADE